MKLIYLSNISLHSNNDYFNLTALNNFKKLISEERLPVLFYIYGGAFYMGAATQETFGPDYFMMEDVILVTTNYRLGPLG